MNETTLETDLRKSNEDLIVFGVLDYSLDQNNHFTAYGGHIGYTLYSTAGPDVILEQSARERKLYGSVNFIESSFRTINGQTVSRKDFMHILHDLTAIYIRYNPIIRSVIYIRYSYIAIIR